jgi:hypothetical protein
MNSHCHNCEDTAKYNVELEQEIAALRKVLEECCSAIEDLINAKIVFENGQYADLYNLIEQTLSKGKTE